MKSRMITSWPVLHSYCPRVSWALFLLTFEFPFFWFVGFSHLLTMFQRLGNELLTLAAQVYLLLSLLFSFNKIKHDHKLSFSKVHIIWKFMILLRQEATFRSCPIIQLLHITYYSTLLLAMHKTEAKENRKSTLICVPSTKCLHYVFAP